MYQIIWTDSAIESLENILAFVIQKWGAQTMLDLDDRIMELIENIKQNPLMFQAIDDTSNLRKCVVNKQVSIIYRVDEDKVFLSLFVDNRSNHQYS